MFFSRKINYVAGSILVTFSILVIKYIQVSAHLPKSCSAKWLLSIYDCKSQPTETGFKISNIIQDFNLENNRMMTASRRLVSVDFEVFGKVQGVFFRKHTQKTAEKYGLVGWVKNTSRGTVVGQVQGADDRIKIMKEWLTTKGSPKSRVARAEFKNEKEVTAPGHQGFIIRK